MLIIQEKKIFACVYKKEERKGKEREHKSVEAGWKSERARHVMAFGAGSLNVKPTDVAFI